MAEDDDLYTSMDALGVDPCVSTPIEMRRALQIGMFAALFAAAPETWPVFMEWMSKHAPAHARMIREQDLGPDTFHEAADVLAGLDAGMHMLGIHEARDS